MTILLIEWLNFLQPLLLCAEKLCSTYWFWLGMTLRHLHQTLNITVDWCFHQKRPLLIHCLAHFTGLKQANLNQGSLRKWQKASIKGFWQSAQFVFLYPTNSHKYWVISLSIIHLKNRPKNKHNYKDYNQQNLPTIKRLTCYSKTFRGRNMSYKV